MHEYERLCSKLKNRNIRKYRELLSAKETEWHPLFEIIEGDVEEWETTLRVSIKCLDRDTCDQKVVEENFLGAFFKFKPQLMEAYTNETFKIIFNFANRNYLELYNLKGRPKRLVDRR